MPKPSEGLKALARRHGARICTMETAKNYPSEPVAFETRDFGWVLSPRAPKTGKRTILVKE